MAPLLHTARRLGHRLRWHLGPARSRARTPLVHHPRYRTGISGIPLDALRGERILAFLLDQGWIGPGNVVEPEPAPVEALRRVHSGSYLRSLDDPEVVARILGTPLGPREARDAVELQRLAAGGTIQAGSLALTRRGPSFHLGGGFHHAGPDQGSALCLLNDVAAAVRHLRAHGFEEPVLVVDLDIHDGNGTRVAFAQDPTVHTFSIHNRTWDEAPALADTRLAVGEGIEDGPYLSLLRRELPPVVASHRPGLTFYVAGADVAREDAYGDAHLTPEGVLARDRFVVETLRAGVGHRHPVAVLLGGGYGPSAWRYPARFAAWLLTGRAVVLPDDLSVSLGRVRWMEPEGGAPARGASGPARGGPPAGGRGTEDLFALSPEDLAPVGGGPPAEAELLGRTSPGEVERDLERFGILGQIRARGYPSPFVQILPTSGLGPTVRVFGASDRSELLMELRVELDAATLPGFALLRVGWLLLQDPRARFAESRRPLPGQDHPGLGVLADVVAWLVTRCRALGLDGLTFRSSHFHMAALARRHLHFLHPEAEERFRRILDLAGGRPLAQLSRDVAAGEIADPGPPRRTLRWMDVDMVVPVTPRLKRRLERGRPGTGERGAAGAGGY